MIIKGRYLLEEVVVQIPMCIYIALNYKESPTYIPESAPLYVLLAPEIHAYELIY